MRAAELKVGTQGGAGAAADGRATHMGNRLAVRDALLWEPSGGYFLLDGHLRRLERSAAHFGFPLDVGVAREALTDYARRFSTQPRKVRLDLAATGAMALRAEDVKPSTPVVAVLSEGPVHSGDELLRHKTSCREGFDRALQAHREAQDVLLWNERGELTETCYGNVVLEIEGRRFTPPLSCGLLPGVFRAHLLERGEIQERTLPVRSLEAASAVFLINSVRRFCEIRLLRPSSGSPHGTGR
jgi:branched-subunit amino acid aminotransferase/4-amino-4-deoxychorismate lyase